MKKIINKYILTIFLTIVLSLITTISVALAQDVKIGGEIIGFSLPYKGVCVVSVNEVQTNDGDKSFQNIFIKGDRIISIDGVPINKVSDITLYLEKIEDGKSVVVEYIRNNKNHTIELVPLIDKSTNIKKLGIVGKDSVTGLGTLTYVKEDGSFGALGHSVTDSETTVKISDATGSVYNCIVNGVKKGEKGNAGAICGYLTGDKIGKISSANQFGIYGDTMINNANVYTVATKEEIKPGKAQICSTISGVKEFYDIEIIRAFYQKTDRDKGLIIKVKDPRLIALTGGIVQGMSGSPIIQNGKLVGAVTHVFVNDPTRGYGIYIDSMLSCS